MKHTIAFLLLTTLSAFTQPTTSVGLTWTPNTESDLKTYKVHRGDTAGSYNFALTNGLSTQVTVSNLVAGRTYFFVVTAVNHGNLESGPSNEVTYKVPSGDPTGPVTGFTFVRTASKVTVSWARQGAIGSERWRIRWIQTGALTGTQTANVTEPRHEFPANPGAAYTVSITAEGIQGFGPESTFQVPAMPAAPKSLALSPNGEIVWTFPKP